MDIILLVLHVVLSLGIITLVLLQKGAGASAGAAFGGGGAGSVFGATGSANFLSKTTAILAIGFFINSLALAYLAANREVKTDSVLDVLTAPATELSAPAEGMSDEGQPIESDVPMADIPAVDIPAANDMQAAPDLDMPPADAPLPAGE